MRLRKEVQIGIALVLAAATLFVGQRFLRDLPVFSRVSTYHTLTSNAGGVAVGSVIWTKGVRVGTVSDVRFFEGEVLLSFSLEANLRIPHGTTVSIGGLSFLGSTQVDLVSSRMDTTYHAPGDTIPPSDAVGLFDQLSDAAPDLLDQFNDVLETTNSSVSSIQTMLDEPDSDLRSALQSVGIAANSFSELLQAQNDQLTAALANINTLAETLTTLTRDSLSYTVENVNDVITNLDGNLAALEETTTSLNILIGRINSGEGTLGKLATDDSLYTEVTGAASALRRILEDLEENPRKYLREIRLVDIF